MLMLLSQLLHTTLALQCPTLKSSFSYIVKLHVIPQRRWSRICMVSYHTVHYSCDIDWTREHNATVR